jgi:hypothetical protein
MLDSYILKGILIAPVQSKVRCPILGALFSYATEEKFR